MRSFILKIYQIILHQGLYNLYHRAQLKCLRVGRKSFSFITLSLFSSIKIANTTELLFILKARTNTFEKFTGINGDYLHHCLNHQFKIFSLDFEAVNFRQTHLPDQGELLKNKLITPRDSEYFKKNINLSNQRAAHRIYCNIDPHYQFIDWQQDFKSGYRWSSKTNSKFLRHVGLAGVDVKVPWELARMHHLVNLALSFSKDKQSEISRSCLAEFRNQVLDFISTNPPGYGVNWICPMDMGIRVTNWVTAFHIFQSNGAMFDPFFLKCFKGSLLAHGKFIQENLEIEANIRANHYLANLTGLASLSSILPVSSLTNGWLAYVLQELEKEMFFQFQEDGSNFEGSTYYHCESLEFIIYSTLLLESTPRQRIADATNPILSRFSNSFFKPPLHFDQRNLGHQETLLSKSFYKKLFQAIDFIDVISLPDHSLPLIGDNDSGKLFHLFFQNRQNIYSSDLADPISGIGQEILLFCNLMFGKNYHIHNTLDQNGYNYFLDYFIEKEYFLKNLSSLEFETCSPLITPLQSKSPSQSIFPEFNQADAININVNTHDLKCYEFINFGLIIYKSNLTYLSIRNFDISQPNPTSHFHCDQLSLILWSEGDYLAIDPGAYCYQSSSVSRNLYRSANAHVGVFDNSDYAPLTSNTFSGVHLPEVSSYLTTERSASFTFTKNNKVATFEVLFENSMITLFFHNCNLNRATRVNNVLVSPSYGVISNKYSCDI